MNRAKHIERWLELITVTFMVNLISFIAVPSLAYPPRPRAHLLEISIVGFVMSLPISWTAIAFCRYRSVGQCVFTAVMIVFSGAWAWVALNIGWELIRTIFP